MKKLMIFAAAAALLVACEKPEGTEIPTEVTVESTGTIEYAGVTYKTVTYSNGHTWMAENLRYIPEGVEVSSNPLTGGEVFYPYHIVEKKAVALTDDASVKKLGLLYNHDIALGIDKAKAQEYIDGKNDAEYTKYMQSFEGKRGICPEGWHIPTCDEMAALSGYRNGVKNEPRYPVEKCNPVEDIYAPLYDKEYHRGKLENFSKAGLDLQFPGFVNKTTFDKAGMYLAVPVKETCTVAEWVGQQSMNGFIGSTFYLTSKTFNNAQFWGLQTSFATAFPNGSIYVAFNNIGSAYSVRCVKNR